MVRILNEECLKLLGMTINVLSLELRVPSNRIYGIVEGKRGISADTGLRLARYFGTSADFRMNLQSHYELEVIRKEAEEGVERAIRPREQPV